MTKDEALKLALEALEVANSCVDGYYIPKGKTHLPEIELAITAIKEALAQPEQEPVAWVHHLTFKNLNSFERSRYSTTLAKKQTDACCIPLYTTPPQRTWVGLTEDEAFACKGRDYFETYQAIEAKLKEKNT